MKTLTAFVNNLDCPARQFLSRSLLLSIAILVIVPSIATSQERSFASPVGGAVEMRGEWAALSPTRILSGVAAELFWRTSELFGGVGSSHSQEPIPLLTPDDLRSRASVELDKLRDLKRPLTSVDTQPFWSTVHQLHQSGFENRQSVVNFYSDLGELEVGLEDRLEISRFVGQDHMFARRFSQAADYFQAAEVAFEAASHAEKRAEASTMANIIYLRGMLLMRLEDAEQGAKNDIELATNPLFAPHIEPLTRLTILERLGDHRTKQSSFDEAQGYYQKAVDLLITLGDQESQLDHHVRVALKELLARAKAREFENKELRDGLRSLQKKFENKFYVGFEQILQAIVVADTELEDKEALITDLGTLRDWYFKQLKSGREKSVFEHRWRDDVVSASKLLILTLYQSNQKDKAKAVIKETEEHLKLNESWKQDLPRELRQSSVVELAK